VLQLCQETLTDGSSLRPSDLGYEVRLNADPPDVVDLVFVSSGYKGPQLSGTNVVVLPSNSWRSDHEGYQVSRNDGRRVILRVVARAAETGTRDEPILLPDPFLVLGGQPSYRKNSAHKDDEAPGRE
jgi:hypothetical protein